VEKRGKQYLLPLLSTPRMFITTRLTQRVNPPVNPG